MNFRKILVGGAVLASVFLGLNACTQEQPESPKEQPESPEAQKVSAGFAQTEVSVPVNGTAVLTLEVTPADRTGEVTVTVADESVVELSDRQLTETGVTYILKPLKLSSTTIYAIHDDFDSPLECAVTVTPVGVESVSLDKTSIDLKVGETFSFNTTVSPADATSPVLIWKSDNEEVATVDNGKVTAVKEGAATVTVTCNGHTAQCAVNVSATAAESVTLSCELADLSQTVELTAGETILVNATILPEDVTYLDVVWTVSPETVLSCEPFDAVADDNIVSAHITALAEGSAVVTAKIDGAEAKFEVNVKPVVVPVADPKVGDYFYSDGTWSDGGLVSIKEDGTNPVWKEQKPAPEEGKTVIGIVFQTNRDRIYEGLTEAGYTHGLVIGTAEVYASYTLDDSFGCIGGTRYTGYRWYNDILGKYWTDRVVKYYPGTDIRQCPVFDFVTTDYRLPAPAGTSGWYVPAIGELWDFIANLGGEEIASYLKLYRDYGIEYESATDDSIDQSAFDITDRDEKKLTYNLLDRLNECWSLVPEAQRDNLRYIYGSGDNLTCQLMSASVYIKGESCCIFEITKGNGFSFQPGWQYGDKMICHPVLAF